MIREELRREIAQNKHDPMRLLSIIGAVIAYLIIFGTLYTPNIVKNVPCIIYNEDNSALSREVVQKIDDHESLSIIGYAASEAEMQAAVREKEAVVAISLPPDFAKKAQTGSYSTVLYLVNGANIITTNVTSSAMQEIVADVSDKLAAHKMAMLSGSDESLLMKRIHPVQVNLRVLYNQTQGYSFFFLIGLAMIAFQQGVFLGSGAAFVYEIQHPDKKISRRNLIFRLLIKFIFYYILAAVSFTIGMLIIIYGLQIPFKADPLSVFLLAGVFIFAVISFIMFFASWFSDEVSFIRAITLYPVPAFILSGYTWPQESMSYGLQIVARLFPFNYFANEMRDLCLIGTTVTYTNSIISLGVMGIVFMALSLYLIPKRSYEIWKI